MSRLTAPATDANAKVARGTIRPREAAEQEAVVSRLSVLNAKPTLLDFNLIEKGISERTTAETSRGAAFVRYVLATVFDLHSDDLDQHTVDGGQDRGSISFISTTRTASSISVLAGPSLISETHIALSQVK